MRKFLLTCLVMCSVYSTYAQSSAESPKVLPTPPEQNVGVTSKSYPTISLENEVSLKDFVLRVRAVTIAPGGYTAAHVHQGRPTQEFVAQGTVIEVRNGVPIVHHAGDTVQGVNGVHHWWENHGPEPVVLVPVDVTKP